MGLKKHVVGNAMHTMKLIVAMFEALLQNCAGSCYGDKPPLLRRQGNWFLKGSVARSPPSWVPPTQKIFWASLMPQAPLTSYNTKTK